MTANDYSNRGTKPVPYDDRRIERAIKPWTDAIAGQVEFVKLKLALLKKCILELVEQSECSSEKPAEMQVRQIEISIWHKDQNPLVDLPRERFGIVQNSLEETIAFAAEAIRAHWHGECDCLKENAEKDGALK